MAHGHPEARRYPLPHLWRQTRIVRRRTDRLLVSEVVLLQMGVAAIFSKDAGKSFARRIEELQKD